MICHYSSAVWRSGGLVQDPGPLMTPAAVPINVMATSQAEKGVSHFCSAGPLLLSTEAATAECSLMSRS